MPGSSATAQPVIQPVPDRQGRDHQDRTERTASPASAVLERLPDRSIIGGNEGNCGSVETTSPHLTQ